MEEELIIYHRNKKLKKENHILKQYKQAVEENNIVSIPEHGMVF